MVAKLAGVGLRARAAIADTWGAAHALARFAARPGYRLRAGKAPRPMSAACRSGRCGLRPIWSTVSACSASTASAIWWRSRARRWRCASAPSWAAASTRPSAASPSRSSRSAPTELIEVRRVFAEPIGAAETIARYIGKLAAQLCDALGAEGPRRAAARSHLPPRRQSRPGRARRHRPAAARRQAPDPAALRQDRDHRSRLRHRDHDAGRDRGGAAGAEAGGLEPGRGAGARRLRPDRPPRQPGRRTEPLSHGARGERRARAVGAPHPGAGAGDRRGLARPLAAAGAAARPSGADRHRGAAAGPPARVLHLARRAPAGEARRRPRAGLRRMVEARPRACRGARLFPDRGRCRRALLGLSAPATARTR